MIGDKRLEMPETVDESLAIYETFGLSHIGLVADKVQIYNACKLVELNNELYNKLQDLEDRINKLDGED
jgi:hypothetical protein